MESRGANGDLVVYDYRPEREDAPVGTVAVNRLIERMSEENVFPEKAMAAWW